MMTVREAIAARRSVRDYAETPVPREMIEQLLAAAAQAPSAMDTQAWSFGVIQDAARLREIGEHTRQQLLDEYDRQGEKMPALRERAASPAFVPFYNAGTLVVIYATAPSAFAAINCALAAQNLMLAATELGLGTCWIGLGAMYMNDPKTKEALGVPADYQAIATIIVGYPAGELPEKPKNPPAVLYWQ